MSKLTDQAKADREALELRKAGASVEAIARALDFDDTQSVIEGIQRALGALLPSSLDEIERLELERLDAMQRALWPSAMKGQWLAVDRCLAIMERRAQLLGLDGEREKPEAKDGIDQLAERRANRRSGIAASARSSRS